MYMPLTSPSWAAFHDLDHGEAGLRIELGVPVGREVGAPLGIGHRLVVREHHRDETGVGGALDVVLPAQRMQTGAGAAHLAGDQRQRDQAARIVGAVDMLGDAHAPEDDRRLGASVEAGDLAQHVGLDAADGPHLLRRVSREVALEPLEPLGVRVDVLPVVELVLDDDVHQRVEQRHVRAGRELEEVARMAGERRAARVDHDQLRTPFRRVLEEGRGHRVVRGRLGADHDDDVGMLDLVEAPP